MMTPGMKMMMLEKAKRENQESRARSDQEMRNRYGYEGRAENRNGYENRMENRYDYDGRMENRGTRKVDIEYEEIRDGYEPESRNRRRYRDGRFAPRNDNGSMEMERAVPWYEQAQNRYTGPKYEDRGMENRYRMNDEGGRMVGFEDRNRGYEANYSMGGQEWHSGNMAHGGAMSRERRHLDQKTAKEWVQEMGESFSMEETMEALKKRKCKCEPLEFWVIVNAMKSDYPKLAAKYGVDHLDFFADMAVEWLEDRDAKPGKAVNYYNYVVRHE